METETIIRSDKEFIGDLRQELMSTQSARLKLTLQKLIFITGLLAVGGTMPSPKPEMNPLLLAPLVAIIFDLFIEGENFGIRRIGIFLKLISAVPKTESIWETVLNMRRPNKTKLGKYFPKYLHRDIFAHWANPIATLTVYTITIIYILHNRADLKIFAYWYIPIIIILILFWLYSKAIIMRNRLDRIDSALKNSL